MKCTECGKKSKALTTLSSKIVVCDQCRMEITRKLIDQLIVEHYAKL